MCSGSRRVDPATCSSDPQLARHETVQSPESHRRETQHSPWSPHCSGQAPVSHQCHYYSDCFTALQPATVHSGPLPAFSRATISAPDCVHAATAVPVASHSQSRSDHSAVKFTLSGEHFAFLHPIQWADQGRGGQSMCKVCNLHLDNITLKSYLPCNGLPEQ